MEEASVILGKGREVMMRIRGAKPPSTHSRLHCALLSHVPFSGSLANSSTLDYSLSLWTADIGITNYL